MPITCRNCDLVLEVRDATPETGNVVNKYDAFLDALCSERYAFQRTAIKQALRFLVSAVYPDTRALAIENYERNERLHVRYATLQDYLATFPLADHKSVSLDLATGTGKSWVLYGLARILLAEGLVDRVLVLCPSLTIEEGLKEKFLQLGADPNLKAILQELGAVYAGADVKNAADPIRPGDICVENIHAVYERTGSSIEDSFKGKGGQTLVLNDEAHHIFSRADSATKRWLEFLRNPDYGFRYMVHVSGTPYIGDDYFTDVAYRYGLKQAIDERVVKQIDYKLDELVGREAGLQETWHNHQLNREKHAGRLKPITIIVTEKIASCVRVWREVVDFIVGQEKISREEAEKRVIWVASGIPGGADGEYVKRLIRKPEAVRKENVQLLKSVDDPTSPVEWIVSVSMLTEGWDVKNVFQIVPHENKAFNSKLLIAQVLGRGLRIPPGLEWPVMVKVNNHERWTAEIANLYRDVLEIENRISWGWHEASRAHSFPLHNIEYKQVQQTVEKKQKPADDPEKVAFVPQVRTWEEASTYRHSGRVLTMIENRDIFTIPEAVRRMKIFLNDKNPRLSRRWSSKRLAEFITRNLEARGYPADFLSLENLWLAQQAFGPPMREFGTESPRMKWAPDDLREVQPEAVHRQSVSEEAIKGHSTVFYAESSGDGLEVAEERAVWGEMQKAQAAAASVGREMLNDEVRRLVDHLVPVPKGTFKTPWNFLVASSEPERTFIEYLLQHAALFDGFIKSPDRGFYSLPYSYKPTTRGKTHSRTERFNPDFFLKLAGKNEILVVEIKDDNDDANRNRAKLRDATEHFAELNRQLAASGVPWIYHFKFLTPEDYPDFFDSVKRGEYGTWLSRRMRTSTP